MLRLASDADVHGDIIRGLRPRVPTSSAAIMSLTLLLFGGAPPGPAVPAGWQPCGMGTPAEVRERINAALGNGVGWFKDGWGQYGDDSCMLEFHVPDEDPVVCVMMHVRGAGAVETLLTLAQNNGWCLVDDSLTMMSDGWQA